MRKTRSKDGRSKTLPSSPSHSFSLSSSSSSDFEFSISLSPHKSSPTHFCPADELFFKGQILPLHLSPRLSMVQTLSLSLSPSSSTTSCTTTSRDSTGSSNDLFLLTESCDSSRPSSVTEEDGFKRFSNFSSYYHLLNSQNPQIKKPPNVFKRFSNVFRKDSTKNRGDQENFQGSNSVKRMSQSAKEMMRKYLKKVKPFYEKLSQNKQQQQQQSRVLNSGKELNRGLSQSFSENLRYPRRRNCVSSCPSSMRSSPSRVISTTESTNGSSLYSSNSSSMEELQSAIQGAIAHCKNSMIQKKKLVISKEIII
ncbi:hypothetical protein BVC80_9013g24 [Macleaya cordata]|uniref:Membrane-associated kinase regulator 1 n=1 Tax=Macleaya cordata TaxID=56857 RepID=A0A200QQ33_MACCD|nr:hypothetical protein BVC80_9013g24 [Macleaya cordata]